MNFNEINEEIVGASSATRDKVRQKVTSDLYVLSKGILGFEDLTPSTHRDFCRLFDSVVRHQRMGLMPRGHLKTSIGTVADGIRIPLIDANARILIANEVIQNAKDMQSEIMAHFEKNETLRLLFPERIPDKFQGAGIVWSSERATIPRTGIYKEATWTSIGVGGAPTSKHFTHIKCDDLIGLEASRSAAVMQYAIKWANNLRSLIISEQQTTIDWIGTHWGNHDLYMHIKRMFGTKLAYFKRSCYNEDGSVFFPERFTKEFFEELRRIDPIIFYAQYLNEPNPDEVKDFNAAHIHYFKHNGANIEYNYAGRQIKIPWAYLDKVLMVDPNSGKKTAKDEAALVVAAADQYNNRFNLETDSGRFSPTELVDRAYELACKWNVRKAVFEEAGQQNTGHYFTKKGTESGRMFTVSYVKPDTRDKETRIRQSFHPVLSQGRFYTYAGDGTINQIEFFPDLVLWDLIDATSYVQGELVPANVEEMARAEESSDQIIAAMLKQRNSTTGY